MLDRVFEYLQREQITRIKLEAVSMDNTIVKVHPDGTGAEVQSGGQHRTERKRFDLVDEGRQDPPTADNRGCGRSGCITSTAGRHGWDRPLGADQL